MHINSEFLHSPAFDVSDGDDSAGFWQNNVRLLVVTTQYTQDEQNYRVVHRYAR